MALDHLVVWRWRWRVHRRHFSVWHWSRPRQIEDVEVPLHYFWRSLSHLGCGSSAPSASNAVAYALLVGEGTQDCCPTRKCSYCGFHSLPHMLIHTRIRLLPITLVSRVLTSNGSRYSRRWPIHRRGSSSVSHTSNLCLLVVSRPSTSSSLQDLAIRRWRCVCSPMQDLSLILQVHDYGHATARHSAFLHHHFVRNHAPPLIRKQGLTVYSSGLCCHYIKNGRCLVMIISNIPPLVGCFMIYFLPSEDKLTRLSGTWIFATNTISYIMIMSLVASNVAGYTRKLTVGAGECAHSSWQKRTS